MRVIVAFNSKNVPFFPDQTCAKKPNRAKMAFYE
jgi:hypothetical protein